LRWIAALTVYLGLRGLAHAVMGRSALDLAPTLVLAPVTGVFLLWSGWVLSARRIPRPDLVPFAIVGAVSIAIYSVGARVYLPHLFSTYATRYGVVGAVLAMISALFYGMVLLVASAATGREVSDELDRIRRGVRPADDEVRRQWHAITAEMRSRWATLGRQVTRADAATNSPDACVRPASSARARWPTGNRTEARVAVPLPSVSVSTALSADARAVRQP
jgi:hypothetical protein